MAAGLGFKDFTTGEVLTAADVDGYLMQGIWVFASAAARNAAVTSPQEGNFAFTKDNNSLWYYDGAAWVASGATGDIEGVTAGVGISGGGTSGTVTITNSMATAIDAKGDLVAGTGADTFARLAVGANNTVLTADSSTATGLKWATPSSGGYTLINSGGTSLSGSSVTISSIPTTYNFLKVVVVSWGINANGFATIDANADNTLFHGKEHASVTTATLGSTVISAGAVNLSGGQDAAANTTNANACIAEFANTGSSSDRKPVTSTATFTGTSGVCTQLRYGEIRTNTAITSIRIATNQTFNAGKVYVYGA